MKEFLSTYPMAVWSVVSVLLAAIVIASLWERVKWWWLNTWYAFPFFGNEARLARDPNRASEGGWFKSELKLCRDYKQYLRLRDEQDFDEKVSYLTKAGDLGRRNTPFAIWLLTCVLVFIEAMGFSYVLAGYTIPGASENLQQLGALGIAFMISVLLVAFTHFSGHELYVSGRIAQARRSWIDEGRSRPLTSGEVALSNPQSKDDSEAAYTQLANRVGTHAKYIITIGTALFVIFVAVGATYVRGQVLEKTLHQSVTGSSLSLDQQGGLNLNALRLPSADAQANAAAQERARQDGENIDRHGGWGTFVVLAFIFVFLQILGVLFGYKWGFAGKQSKDAFRAIGNGRYSSYADVRAHYGEIVDTAQARLESLQQRLMERNGSSGTRGVHSTKSFKDFLHDERAAELRDRNSERHHAEQRKVLVTTTTQIPATLVQTVQVLPEQLQVSAPSTPAVAVAAATTAPLAPARADVSADDELDMLRRQLALKENEAKQAEIARLKAQLAQLNDGTAS